MVLSDRIAQHVRQRRTLGFKKSDLGQSLHAASDDENDENYDESLVNECNFSSPPTATASATSSRQTKIYTTWKSYSASKLLGDGTDSNDTRQALVTSTRHNDNGNHRCHQQFQSPRRTMTPQGSILSSASNPHKMIISSQSLLSNLSAVKGNGDGNIHRKPLFLTEEVPVKLMSEIEKEPGSNSAAVVTRESTRSRVLRQLSSRKHSFRPATHSIPPTDSLSSDAHSFETETETELAATTSFVWKHTPQKKQNHSSNNNLHLHESAKPETTTAELFEATNRSTYNTPPLSASGKRRLWSAVTKKIEMNLALTECNDPNAITRDASTPSSNGKVGTTTSLERELALNQKDPSRRRQSLANHSIDQNSNDKIDTRANLDKRTARLRFSQAFVENLNYHLSREANEYTTGEADLEEDFEVEDIYETPKVLRCGKVAVFVRKRPIFPYEKSRKDFDVVAMSSSSCSGDGDKVTIHNCFMHSDMQHLKIKSWTYPCTMAFDEYSSNERIYKVVADPLVRSVAFNGGCATIMMYGQTGSGKSYTMSAIEKGVCERLFYFLSMAVGSSSSNNSRVVTVRFVELAGKSCRDLLASVGKDPTAKIVDNDDGTVQIMNATQKVCKTTDDLLNLIERGKTRRATEATEINAVSSRSHAVCQVEVFLSDHWKRKDYSKRGILNLIDCAGTERRNDSLYHDTLRQKETQEINASLYALKECIRARAKSSFKSPYVPYRASNLTRLLRESLENEDSKLCVIATIAPNATDTEHTMETLKTVSSIAGNEAQIFSDEPRTFYPNQRKSKVLVSPKEMNHLQLISWFKSQKFSVEFIPEHVDGKSIMRLTAKQIGTQFLYDDQTSLDLYNKIRNENDRVGRIQLEHRKLMKESSKK